MVNDKKFNIASHQKYVVSLFHSQLIFSLILTNYLLLGKFNADYVNNIKEKYVKTNWACGGSYISR